YGHSFAAVALDIAWGEPSWRSRALSITRYLRQHGEPVGVFYNGNADDKSDAAWLNSAREHYGAYEALVGSPPDLAIFQSWAAYPTSVLPETVATTFTNLILDYSASRGRERSPLGLKRTSRGLHHDQIR